jgi:hypothetical protein
MLCLEADLRQATAFDLRGMARRDTVRDQTILGSIPVSRRPSDFQVARFGDASTCLAALPVARGGNVLQVVKRSRFDSWQAASLH